MTGRATPKQTVVYCEELGEAGECIDSVRGLLANPVI